jgi:hypothetical protein
MNTKDSETEQDNLTWDEMVAQLPQCQRCKESRADPFGECCKCGLWHCWMCWHKNGHQGSFYCPACAAQEWIKAMTHMANELASHGYNTTKVDSDGTVEFSMQETEHE